MRGCPTVGSWTFASLYYRCFCPHASLSVLCLSLLFSFWFLLVNRNSASLFLSALLSKCLMHLSRWIFALQNFSVCLPVIYYWTSARMRRMGIKQLRTHGISRSCILLLRLSCQISAHQTSFGLYFYLIHSVLTRSILSDRIRFLALRNLFRSNGKNWSNIPGQPKHGVSLRLCV